MFSILWCLECDRWYILEMGSHMYTDKHILYINDTEIRLTLSMIKKIIKVGNKGR